MPCLDAMRLYDRSSPGSRASISASASSIGAILVELSRVEI
jgi:hypothetical protein